MLPYRSLLKKVTRFLLMLVAVAAIALFVCNKIIVSDTHGKLYANTDEIPFNNVGLLLGTSKYLESGHVNLYYKYRVDAAIELLRSGKIKYLVISGDNGRKEYNEPEMMRADLMNAGIDSNLLFLDYAGFRTFDSVKRLKEIFGQTAVTIISQPFHNERAVYIAGRLQIAAVGFNARNVSKSSGMKTNIREKFARVKVLLDFALGVKPKFLGTPIKIPA